MLTREASVARAGYRFFAARSCLRSGTFRAHAYGLATARGFATAGRVSAIWPGFGAVRVSSLAPLQLAVAMPFSALLVASGVAIEKGP